MNKTKIDWLNGGYTWNPVTGCLHNCEYCYARKIAMRFKDKTITPAEGGIYDLDSDSKNPYGKYLIAGEASTLYPFGFAPTLHRCRLDDPQSHKTPQNVFVCSMADLFGDWVPDEWIKAVFAACREAPQHRYLFLTKNPKRYEKLRIKEMLPEGENFWFGNSVTKEDNPTDLILGVSNFFNTFLSVEPIMGDIAADNQFHTSWIIVGAETGNRKEKVIPKREWIENIAEYCKEKKIPLFMKNSLAGIWGEKLIQQYPWEV